MSDWPPRILGAHRPKPVNINDFHLVSDFWHLTPGWFENFEKKNNKKATRSDLAVVTQALESPDASVISDLSKIVDLDEFYTFWAVESLIKHRDGYAGNVNNYYLYHDPTKGKMIFIPWGLDSVLSSGRSRRNRGSAVHSVIAVGMLANRIYRTPTGREAYREKMRWLLAEVWDEKKLLQRLDKLQKLIRPRLTDPSLFDEERSLLQAYIQERRSEVAPELKGDGPELQSRTMPLAKRRNVGNFSFTFSTEWTASDIAEAGTSGTATGSASVFGKHTEFKSIEVRAGARQSAGRSERTLIAFTAAAKAELPPLRVFLLIEPGEYKARIPIPIDMTRIKGYARMAGKMGMLKGSLFLEKAGSDDHELVSGRVEAEIYSKHEQPKEDITNP